MNKQIEMFHVKPADTNVGWLVDVLSERDWTTSAELIALADKPVTEGNRRWLRALANGSEGKIAGGQKGYKLVKRMTVEEYNHWRNWMSSQADEMFLRICLADKIFYGRKPVESGNGILTP